MPEILESIDVGFVPNPLDSVEDVLNDNNWVYDRMNNEELLVDVAGSVFSYRLCFVWQEDLGALQILCHYDCAVSSANMNLASESLVHMNRSMWMGHFTLTEEDQIPCFRYTCLFHDRESDSVYAHIQDIVDICFAQCHACYVAAIEDKHSI